MQYIIVSKINSYITFNSLTQIRKTIQNNTKREKHNRAEK